MMGGRSIWVRESPGFLCFPRDQPPFLTVTFLTEHTRANQDFSLARKTDLPTELNIEFLLHFL